MVSEVFVSDDQIFRAALLAIVSVAFPIGIYHRVRSQATREPLDRMQEGLFILIAVRFTGLVPWLGVVSFLINPAYRAYVARTGRFLPKSGA